MNIGLVIFSYLMGSINFAYLVARFKGVNIQDLGSGNPGSSNVLRTMGKKYGIIVLIADILKGFIPVIMGLAYDYSLILNSYGIPTNFSVLVDYANNSIFLLYEKNL